MPAESILDDKAEIMGWDTMSQLIICLEYIENQKSDEAFEDFLERRMQEENEG
jgi:hypothetical protein